MMLVKLCALQLTCVNFTNQHVIREIQNIYAQKYELQGPAKWLQMTSVAFHHT